ncbi:MULTISPECIES: SPOR domain-containing protein [unclassified Lebetimonas]|uniref:SPOR domain-containing protein n=1 Tax=unclassified Lebetimonas TaxID=2648158 RepID=UPI000467B44E|nr:MULTISPECIES: SPOR domain-containing protein [unclassified Lebetimonas]
MEKDDLLNIKPKKNIKKPLIYGAIAFLIFIIAVIVYAIYSNSKQENVVLPPQVNETPKESSGGFKEVPIEENTSTISEKLTKNVIINNTNEKNETKVNENRINKTPQNSDQSGMEQSKKQTSEISKNKPTHTLKKESSVKKSVSLRYYIQVAALIKYKKPDKKFLNLIKKEGFDYRIYHTYIIKNHKKIPVTKILIGPFRNEKEAKKNLKIVKEKLTQNAFIFKVK